jgi:hypothetical protein
MSHVLDRIAYQVGDLAAKDCLPPQPWIIVSQGDWPTIESDASRFDGILDEGSDPDTHRVLFGLPVWRSPQVPPNHIEIISEGNLLKRYGTEFEGINEKEYYTTRR